MMHIYKLIKLISTAILISTVSVSVMAGKPDGNGGGKNKDTNSGGSGFQTPNPIQLTITFRDLPADMVQSDGLSYADHSPDSEVKLDAHIDGDSGGNYGNLYLSIQEPEGGRSLFLDIASGCVDGCDNQPFTNHSFNRIGLKVAATESISGGLCGMYYDGQVITAPMQISFYDPELFGIEAPGFADFFPVTKGKSACKGSAASDVTVTRVDASNFTVSGDAACITWPGGRTFGGVSFMPFKFSASINADSVLSCD